MKTYWMVHVPGRTTTKMHVCSKDADDEAERVSRVEGKETSVLTMHHTFKPPTPELYAWSIDQMLNLARSKAKASHRWTCIYAILNRLQADGVVTLQAPHPPDVPPGQQVRAVRCEALALFHEALDKLIVAPQRDADEACDDMAEFIANMKPKWWLNKDEESLVADALETGMVRDIGD